MPIFQKQQKIAAYIVQFPIKQGAYAETYRVKDSAGKNYFLKLFNYAKLHRTQFDNEGKVLEIEISKLLNHPNLIRYRDSGDIVVDGQKLGYLVHDFISGETIAQKTAREQHCSVYDTKQIISGVLNGLKFLHNLPNPVIHNELTIQNVMLDLSGQTPIPKIIDFGYARFLSQDRSAFQKDGLNPFYMATEAFNGIFTPQSDLFSVGAMLYHLLFGLPPYFVDLSKYQQSRQSLEDAALAERQKPLRMPSLDIFELDEQLINVMCKALASNVDERFKTADEFLQALNGETIILNPNVKISNSQTTKATPKPKKKGNGFADVAGMDKLKEQLHVDIIDMLASPEKYKKMGLSLPNGMLFYGPPGCGKTFFAEKFAEEIGSNYMYVKCSDVASPYIHGGQEKIAAIFDEARKNAPTILFLDEIDSMLTDRSKQTNVSESGEVNEFLTQLNNCGEDGVFVIGATNKPNNIDKAALRSGRLEKKIYVPNPDFESRKALFQLYLKNRSDFGIDYDKLAQQAENYVSADIKLITDDAAREAIKRKLDKITMDVLIDVLKTFKPTVSLEEIQTHEAIRDEFEGKKTETKRRAIGFQTTNTDDNSKTKKEGTEHKKIGF